MVSEIVQLFHRRSDVSPQPQITVPSFCAIRAIGPNGFSKSLSLKDCDTSCFDDAFPISGGLAANSFLDVRGPSGVGAGPRSCTTHLFTTTPPKISNCAYLREALVATSGHELSSWRRLAHGRFLGFYPARFPFFSFTLCCS